MMIQSRYSFFLLLCVMCLFVAVTSTTPLPSSPSSPSSSPSSPSSSASHAHAHAHGHGHGHAHGHDHAYTPASHGALSNKKHRVPKVDVATSGMTLEQMEEMHWQSLKHAHDNHLGESHLTERLPVDLNVEDGKHFFELNDQELKLFDETFHKAYPSHPNPRLIDPHAPQQIHMSLTPVASEMAVGYVTFNATCDTAVVYGTASGVYGQAETGDQITYVDPMAPLHVIRYLHNIRMTQLLPGTTYYYRVGSKSAGLWSDEANFTTFDVKASQVVRVAVYGDLGVVNAQVPPSLLAEVNAGTLDMVLHVGDFGYNMDEVYGANGDLFFSMMEPIVSRVPYMGIMGNHEGAYNFSAFTNRFRNWNYLANASTNDTGANWWFSWDYYSGDALVHMIAVNTEVYYDVTLLPQVIAQWTWIKNDIAAAKQTADWIVAYGHRPMYCSNVDDMPDCSSDAELLRNGPLNQYGLEDAIEGVDLYLTAHEHSYERTFPVWKGAVDPQQNHTYVDASAPVHIVTGAGGCREMFDYYDAVMYGPWSVVRSSTYGYGHLYVYNNTHLYWGQQLSEGADGVDELWMIKTQ